MPNAGIRWSYFLAFFFVGFVLGPSFAHLLELPNKIGLGRGTYFTVQNIYRGRALLAILGWQREAAIVTAEERKRSDVLRASPVR